MGKRRSHFDLRLFGRGGLQARTSSGFSRSGLGVLDSRCVVLGVPGAGIAVGPMTQGTAYRYAVGVALAAACILVWLSLGVGIIGKDGDPANLMYFAVLAVGIIGALIARLRPHGMARALFAMALAQALVAAIASL